MKKADLFDNTMIVFTSDHGDYLGDHWMGEKDLFHDQSVKVPLLIYDPRKEAEVNRGKESNDLVESIDLAPTFLNFFDIKDKPHIMEGRGLQSILHSKDGPISWREYAISEYDYSTRQARKIIGNSHDKAQLFMIRDKRWKYIFAEGFRPMLFDLETDPKELNDLGESKEKEYVEIKKRFYDALFEWARQHHSRTTITKEQIEQRTGKEPPGVLIGVWDEKENSILNEGNKSK
jgi:arylsulfatase A-like enzyme